MSFCSFPGGLHFSEMRLKVKFSLITVVLVRSIRLKLEANIRVGGKLIHYMGTSLWSAWSSAALLIPFIGAVTLGIC